MHLNKQHRRQLVRGIHKYIIFLIIHPFQYFHRQLTSADLQRALQGTQAPTPVIPLQDILTSEGIINSGILDDPTSKS